MFKKGLWALFLLALIIDIKKPAKAGFFIAKVAE
jgi:hypothetical protein